MIAIPACPTQPSKKKKKAANSIIIIIIIIAESADPQNACGQRRCIRPGPFKSAPKQLPSLINPVKNDNNVCICTRQTPAAERRKRLYRASSLHAAAAAVAATAAATATASALPWPAKRRLHYLPSKGRPTKRQRRKVQLTQLGRRVPRPRSMRPCGEGESGGVMEAMGGMGSILMLSSVSAPSRVPHVV